MAWNVLESGVVKVAALIRFNEDGEPIEVYGIGVKSKDGAGATVKVEPIDPLPAPVTDGRANIMIIATLFRQQTDVSAAVRVNTFYALPADGNNGQIVMQLFNAAGALTPGPACVSLLVLYPSPAFYTAPQNDDL